MRPFDNNEKSTCTADAKISSSSSSKSSIFASLVSNSGGDSLISAILTILSIRRETHWDRSAPQTMNANVNHYLRLSYSRGIFINELRTFQLNSFTRSTGYVEFSYNLYMHMYTHAHRIDICTIYNSKRSLPIKLLALGK